MNKEEFQLIRPTLPNTPGIYKYFDKDGNWLYVGKAKELRKRVSQYFVEQKIMNTRLKMLVKQIDKIEYIIVDNETDALILENNLIKNNQPKYNIRLKDDKTYPFIVIKDEPFPRVFFTRKYIKDGSEYLGPYTSVLYTKEIFQTLKSLFPLRTCTLNLSEKKIKEKKYKVCLEYHIGNCNAPCIGLQSTSEYTHNIHKIRDILKGKFGEIKSYMSQQMAESSENLDFEAAHKWKVKTEKLKNFESKSVIFNPKWNNTLTVNLYQFEKKTVINYLIVENGTIVSTKSFEVSNKMKDSVEVVLEQFVIQCLLDHPEIKEVVLPHEISPLPNQTRQTIPLLGDKKKLLLLSYKNARSFALSLITQPKFDKKKQSFDILKELKDKLRLTEIPNYIECFDNSNIQGTNPVSACVVFKNGKPSKKDYRHFHIKTVVGPDDYGSMKEVITRRYKRFVEEKIELPQLIVIDGGKGQLSHAIEALKELGIENKIAIIGIAKRLEEIYFKNDPIPLYIDKKSPALKLIQYMRDEAHRFGIKLHRTTRSKAMITTELSQINGLGEASIQKLLLKLKSVEQIKKSNLSELTEIVGLSRAKKLLDFFQAK